MLSIQCIIPARGGSKEIPKKNIIDFCGKPLIEWTIEQCLASKYISCVWVSSDDQQILDIANTCGAKSIRRPDNISNDYSSSESAWIHAIKFIESTNKIDLIVAPQVTSPLRETKDIDKAIEIFNKEGCDSMFSSIETEDLFFWQRDQHNFLKSVNYNYMNRERRQDGKNQIIENGSFYLFKPEIIKKYNNRLGGKNRALKNEFLENV